MQTLTITDSITANTISPPAGWQASWADCVDSWAIEKWAGLCVGEVALGEKKNNTTPFLAKSAQSQREVAFFSETAWITLSRLGSVLVHEDNTQRVWKAHSTQTQVLPSSYPKPEKGGFSRAANDWMKAWPKMILTCNFRGKKKLGANWRKESSDPPFSLNCQSLLQHFWPQKSDWKLELQDLNWTKGKSTTRYAPSNPNLL